MNTKLESKFDVNNVTFVAQLMKSLRITINISYEMLEKQDDLRTCMAVFAGTAIYHEMLKEGHDDEADKLFEELTIALDETRKMIGVIQVYDNIKKILHARQYRTDVDWNEIMLIKMDVMNGKVTSKEGINDAIKGLSSYSEEIELYQDIFIYLVILMSDIKILNQTDEDLDNADSDDETAPITTDVGVTLIITVSNDDNVTLDTLMSKFDVPVEEKLPEEKVKNLKFGNFYLQAGHVHKEEDLILLIWKVKKIPIQFWYNLPDFYQYVTEKISSILTEKKIGKILEVDVDEIERKYGDKYGDKNDGEEIDEEIDEKINEPVKNGIKIIEVKNTISKVDKDVLSKLIENKKIHTCTECSKQIYKISFECPKNTLTFDIPI